MNSLLAPAIAAGIATFLLACQSYKSDLDRYTEKHVTGPVELPKDPGDVPPEAELFARHRE